MKNTKAYGKRAKKVVQGNTYSKTGIFMKENFIRVKNKEGEFTSGKMVPIIRGNGSRI